MVDPVEAVVNHVAWNLLENRPESRVLRRCRMRVVYRVNNWNAGESTWRVQDRGRIAAVTAVDRPRMRKASRIREALKIGRQAS